MTTKQNNPTRIYRTVSMEERLPEESIMREVLTDQGLLKFQDGKWWLWWQGGDYTEVNPEWWLEEIKPSPTSSKEVANIVLTNAIYSLDKDSAKGLVRELCERFELLPSEDDLTKKCEERTEFMDDHLEHENSWYDGASFILNHIKGGV